MKVSIIVPVYNAADYLGRCVDSLVNQTYSDIEIVLVDDGSKDNSLEKCNKYKIKYPNIIKVIHKENGGVSDARNTGLSVASGEIILFVDSDDCVDSEYVTTFVNMFTEYKVEMAGIEWQPFNNTLPAVTFDDKPMVVKDDITGLLLQNNRLYCAVRYAYRKDILDSNGLVFDKNIRIGEDQKFIYLYSKCISRAAFSQYNGYFYYENDNSASSGAVKPSHYMDLQVREFIYNDCLDKYKKIAYAHYLKGVLAFGLKALKYGTTCEDDIVLKYQRIIRSNIRFLCGSKYIDFKRKSIAIVFIASKTASKMIMKRFRV